MSYILSKEASIEMEHMGSKAISIAKMQKSGNLVPEWFVVSQRAFLDSLTIMQKELLAEGNHVAAFEKFKLSAEVKKQIKQALNTLGLKSAKLAIRPSVIEGDELVEKFVSYLNVTEENIFEQITALWQSGAGQYTAVIVQKMLQPKSSGIVFSIDPKGPQSKNVVITAVRGGADKLLAGEVNGDHYHLTRKGKIEINHLEHDTPVLNDKEKKALARIAIKTEDYFKAPQEIEWAIEDDQIYLIHTKPISNIELAPERKGMSILWDNSKIIENYAGVVSPLSFSFASNAYASFYKKLSKIMGVPSCVVEDNSIIYKNMIGYINGRIYCNINNWCRMLALFPVYRLCKEVPSAELSGRVVPHFSIKDKLCAAFNLTKAALRVMCHFLFLQRKVNKFKLYVEKILDSKDHIIENMELDQLAVYYRNIEKILINYWYVPQVNEFLAMNFLEYSRKLLVNWCGKNGEQLHNALLKQQRSNISSIKQLARVASDDRELLSALASKNNLSISKAISENKEFKQLYDQYLNNFGMRCFEELKLETIALEDDASKLHHEIYSLATGNLTLEKPIFPDKRTRFRELEKLLRNSKIKSWFAKWLMSNLQRQISNRESFTLKRVALIGLIRKIFLAIGKKLSKANKMNHERDVFYLEVDEILGFIEGGLTSYNLAEIVKLRKTQQEQFIKLPSSPHRFSTYGAIGLDLANIHHEHVAFGSDHSFSKKGRGCCRGVVKGKVRVISNPMVEVLADGEIMVAKSTSPGWLACFANSAAVLVEDGDLLSHAAIAARELGVPTIVAISGLTDWLKTGDEVEIDGATGVVIRIEHALPGAKL